MLSDMVHELDIAADPKTVYRAIATREGEAGFWTPKNTAEPKVGSIAEFRFGGEPAALRMRIDALDEGTRVAWTCLGEFPGWKDTRVTWELRPGPEGKGTTLTFRHGNLGPAGYPEAAVGRVNYTWGQVIGRLKAFAETGKPQPFFT